MTTQLLDDLNRQGVRLWSEGGRLRCGGPKRVITPEVIAKLKEHKEEVLRAIADEEWRSHSLDCPCMDCSAREPKYAKPIKSTSEVFELARKRFPDRNDLPAPPPVPGRDPLAKRGTDKARFFSSDWRQAWPQDFEPYGGNG
jgi:hypothetical protein